MHKHWLHWQPPISQRRARLESMQRQYALGAASYVQLLTAQQQAQQNRINLIAAQSQRLVDSAALYQALGGGWVASVESLL